MRSPTGQENVAVLILGRVIFHVDLSQLSYVLTALLKNFSLTSIYFFKKIESSISVAGFYV